MSITKKQIRQIEETVVKIVSEKIVLKKNQQNYYKLVAQAYEEAPMLETTAVKHWVALNRSNHSWFERIHKEVKLIFYSTIGVNSGSISVNGSSFELVYLDKDPYATQAELKNDYIQNKTIYISIDYSEHPYFSTEDNIIFRFVHDFLVHIKGNYSFGRGELNSYNLHIKLVPKDAVPALFTEIVGQASYAMTNGGFPPQKIAMLKGFDFYNIGVYNNELVSENKKHILVSKIIREELDKLNEDITSGQSIVWHRTKYVKNIKSIQKSGFNGSIRSVFGVGVYACFNIEDQLTESNISRYGKVLVECKLKSLKDFLILFPQEAKNIYGEKNWGIKDQLKTILGVKLYNQMMRDEPLSEELCNTIDSGKFMLKRYDDELEVFRGYIQGIVYNSNADGKAIVCYNETNLIPLQYSEDDGNTWKPIVNKDVYDMNKKSIEYSDNEYQHLNSTSIYNLLLTNPKVADKLKIENLRDDHILGLLKKYPESSILKDKLLKLLAEIHQQYKVIHYLIENPTDFDKLKKFGFNMKQITGENLFELIKKDVKLIPKLKKNLKDDEDDEFQEYLEEDPILFKLVKSLK